MRVGAAHPRDGEADGRLARHMARQGGAAQPSRALSWLGSYTARLPHKPMRVNESYHSKYPSCSSRQPEHKRWLLAIPNFKSLPPLPEARSSSTRPLRSEFGARIRDIGEIHSAQITSCKLHPPLTKVYYYYSRCARAPSCGSVRMWSLSATRRATLLRGVWRSLRWREHRHLSAVEVVCIHTHT